MSSARFLPRAAIRRCRSTFIRSRSSRLRCLARSETFGVFCMPFSRTPFFADRAAWFRFALSFSFANRGLCAGDFGALLPVAWLCALCWLLLGAPGCCCAADADEEGDDAGALFSSARSAACCVGCAGCGSGAAAAAGAPATAAN